LIIVLTTIPPRISQTQNGVAGCAIDRRGSEAKKIGVLFLMMPAQERPVKFSAQADCLRGSE